MTDAGSKNIVDVTLLIKKSFTLVAERFGKLLTTLRPTSLKYLLKQFDSSVGSIMIRLLKLSLYGVD